MSIKKIFIISIIIGLLVPIFTHAQIKITEIMYDPEGSDSKREWIEIYNSGTQSIDLSTWFLYEGNVFHKLIANTTATLAPGSYAIIADSIPEVLAEYVEYVGQIFDSVFSLNNTGESVSMANSQKVLIDTATYSSDMGGNNTGQSIQLNEGAVIVAGPTFGGVNKTESEVIGADEPDVATSTMPSSGSSSGDSTHEQQESISKYTPSSPFKIGAGRDRVVSINTPVEFEAYLSQPDQSPRYLWNFGDFETDTGRKSTHVYQQTGVYQVVLEGKTGDHLSISRTEVLVIEPELDIVHSTSGIMVHNKVRQEINLGGFVFDFEKGKTTIPRNTILSGGSRIVLPVSTSTVLQAFLYPNGEIYRQFDTILEVIE